MANSGQFKPGHVKRGGKVKGSKERYPRSARRHIEWLLAKYGTDPKLLDAAMRRGLMARPGAAAAYCKMVIEHLTGAPEQTVAVVTQVIDELHVTKP